MSVESGEWVVYHPPKSVSFGHQSRMRDPRRTWPTVERFMAGRQVIARPDFFRIINPLSDRR
jgi:hypothetical protein